MHYLIKKRPEQPNSEATRVEYPIVVRHIDELAGRTIGGWALSNLREQPSGRRSIYIATSLGSPGRAQYGKGFIVERVED